MRNRPQQQLAPGAPWPAGPARHCAAAADVPPGDIRCNVTRQCQCLISCLPSIPEPTTARLGCKACQLQHQPSGMVHIFVQATCRISHLQRWLAVVGIIPDALAEQIQHVEQHEDATRVAADWQRQRKHQLLHRQQPRPRATPANTQRASSKTAGQVLDHKRYSITVTQQGCGVSACCWAATGGAAVQVHMPQMTATAAHCSTVIISLTPSAVALPYRLWLPHSCCAPCHDVMPRAHL